MGLVGEAEEGSETGEAGLARPLLCPCEPRIAAPARSGLDIQAQSCPFPRSPFVLDTTIRKGGSNEVHAADPPREHAGSGNAGVGGPLRGRAEGDRRRLPGHQPDRGRDSRRVDGVPGDRNDRPRRERRGPDHRRPVRRRQGGARRLPLLRSREPRRGDRARVADPGGPARRSDRDPAAQGGLLSLEQVFRDEWGRVLAALIGFLGDFDLAEEAAQEAFAAAAERWPREGTPSNPRAWLVTTARNRAIDRIRRDRTLTVKTRLLDVPETTEDEVDDTTIPDERLELLFTCCHPALALDAQVALTLRTLGGLTTERLARALLGPEKRMA